MIDFMRDGGVSMWVLLVSAIATLGVAWARPKGSRPIVLLAGSVLALIEGVLGMAIGMQAVAAHYTRFPDHTAALAEGLRELSNNGLLGGAIALLLGAAALVTRTRLPAPERACASA